MVGTRVTGTPDALQVGGEGTTGGQDDILGTQVLVENAENVRGGQAAVITGQA
jgi:hypothetical protein